MRKFLIVAILGALMLLVSCDKFGIKPTENYDTADSAQVAEFVNSVTNPQIIAVEEALSLKQSMLEKQEVDSAFLSLPDNIISNVTTVLLKKKQLVYKKSIVDEYRRCADVYNNIPKSTLTVNTQVDKGATDLGSRRDTGIISTSYTFRTDTIDGKPVKIRITTTEAYE